MGFWRVGLILVLMLMMGLIQASYSMQGYRVYEPVVLDVWPDGSIYVYTLVNVTDAPQRIVLPTVGKPLIAMASEEGELIPIDYNETYLWVDVPSPGMVNVTYMTVSSSYKLGAEWLVKYNVPWTTRIILPRDALLLGVNASRVIDAGYMQDHRVYLELGEGKVSVEYVRLPPPTTSSTTSLTSTSSTTITTNPPSSSITTSTASPPPSGTLTTTLTSISTPTGTIHTSSTSPEAPPAGSLTTTSGGASTGGGGVTTAGGGHRVAAAVIGAGLIIVLTAAFYLAYRHRSLKQGEPVIMEELDERDKAIIELIREKGPLTAPEISESTGIPKSPLYRRLRRLVDEGVLEARRVSGRTVYSLRRKH